MRQLSENLPKTVESGGHSVFAVTSTQAEAYCQRGELIIFFSVFLSLTDRISLRYGNQWMCVSLLLLLKQVLLSTT